MARGAVEDAADTTFCVRCGGAVHYDAVYLGHLGDYRCPRCGHARPPLDLAARDVRLDGVDGSAFRLDAPDGSSEVRLGVPGLYNVENALGALALAYALGVPTAAARRAAGRLPRRVRPLRAADAPATASVVLLLVKNPAGANEALRTVREAVRERRWCWRSTTASPTGATSRGSGTSTSRRRCPAPSTSWRPAPGPPTSPCASATPAPTRRASSWSRSWSTALDRGLELAGPGGTAYVLPTYTAMLELQRLVAARGLARPYWEARA